MIDFRCSEPLCTLIVTRGIKAGLGIKAGFGMGIFAGLKVKITEWSSLARVCAKTKPENLISGYWNELGN